VAIQSDSQNKDTGLGTGPLAYIAKRRASVPVQSRRLIEPLTPRAGWVGSLQPGPVPTCQVSTSQLSSSDKGGRARALGRDHSSNSTGRPGRCSCTHPALSEADQQPGLKPPPVQRTRLRSGLGPLRVGAGAVSGCSRGHSARDAAAGTVAVASDARALRPGGVGWQGCGGAITLPSRA